MTFSNLETDAVPPSTGMTMDDGVLIRIPKFDAIARFPSFQTKDEPKMATATWKIREKY